MLKLHSEKKKAEVEYHATMESCSDKFHVDIPNVVSRPCCTYGKHIYPCHVLITSDRSDRLASPSETNEN
jgi:hypothetical protein